MKNNISRLFYKEYYRDVRFDNLLNPNNQSLGDVTDINNEIKSSDLEVIDKPTEGMNTFRAKVLYPGLLTGTGLVHDSKKIPGGYNLGMHFDYTFGMPIVYGSSVKGVLRQYFKEFCTDKKNAEDLYQAIFEGKRRVDSNYQNIPLYERDVFFDAVVVKTYVDRSKQSHLLEDDFITPHTEGPLKNPVPIAMLKIASGCTLEFRFLLHNTNINGRTYGAVFKMKIFKKILATVGIGAKTNVGYGAIEIVHDNN